MDGRSLPQLRTAVPGPASVAWIDRLARHECPAITARRARRAERIAGPGAKADPIVWAEAVGANVRDVDGNVFVDLTAGFGVAAAGHRNPRVVAALREQSGRLLHAMGDAFPDPARIELLERLAGLTGLERAILGSSGSDAVEAAIKTARMATGRDAVVAFSGGYHGLSFGALAASAYGHRAFRAPFRGQLGPHVRHAPFGGPLPPLDDVAAVLVEPVQARGGVRVPPAGWLASVVEQAHEAGALVIFDEIFTGFGRTGTLFRFEADPGRAPDLLCVGKGLSSAFPISACLGRAAVMDAWGRSAGPAIHTQTFLGNPLGSAMALASIDEVLRLLPGVPAKADHLRRRLGDLGLPVRGAGLLLAVDLPDPLRASRALLERGFIALPAGEPDEMLLGPVRPRPTLALHPPLSITRAQLDAFVDALAAILEDDAGRPDAGDADAPGEGRGR